MMLTFRDHFSDNSKAYKVYRPGYPEELFQYLASVAPSTQMVWDCATGSGQAAIRLAQYFSTVIATDASAQQIQQAEPARNVVYQVAPAEKSPISSNSIDVISVAQALHWFDVKKFFLEAERVLKHGGILAVWSYNLLTLTPELDALLKEFYQKIVGQYWPTERQHVESGYKNITFPFTPIAVPQFNMLAQWTLEELIGYLNTWSAAKRYKEDKGVNPVDLISKRLLSCWGDPVRQLNVSWPLSLIVGIKDISWSSHKKE